MNVSKNQIIQFLESQGNHDQAQRARHKLPDQVDTDNQDHTSMLSTLGVDATKLGEILTKFGNLA